MSDDREILKHSLRQLAEEARQGNPPNASDAHPSVEDLVAYHAGELSESAAGKIQRHLGTCHECPEVILALDAFSDPASGSGIPPAGVDSAWQEVRQRLAEEGWFEDEPAGGPWTWAAHLTPQRRLVAAMAMVVLACLVVFVVLGDRQPRIVDQLEAGAPSLDLLPATRGSVQEIAVPREAAYFYLGISPEGPLSDSGYQVEIWTAQGRLCWSHAWHLKSAADLYLKIPRGFLPAGKYRVELHGLEGGRPLREPTDERPFRLSYPSASPSSP